MTFAVSLGAGYILDSAQAQSPPQIQDAKNVTTQRPDPPHDPTLEQHGIYAATAPRAKSTAAITTKLPLELEPGARIAMVGNMLLERSQYFGYIETLLHQRLGTHQLVVRHLGWPADTVTLRPRPDNFADVEQHLYHERADVILAAFGFNESFDGADGLPAFSAALHDYVTKLKSTAFNDRGGPKIVLLSPIANENVQGVQRL